MSIQAIIDNLHIKPLSESLQNLLLLATQKNDLELVKWVKLELIGYYGSDIPEDDLVPEYRRVNGYHTDDYNRKFLIEDEKLQFINTIHLREGVVELEIYTENGLILKDQSVCNIIFENLNVKVTSFHVSDSQIKSVLAKVKFELVNRISSFEPKKEEQSSISGINEDILELKPNIYGLGINLNALKRRWFR